MMPNNEDIKKINLDVTLNMDGDRIKHVKLFQKGDLYIVDSEMTGEKPEHHECITFGTALCMFLVKMHVLI